MRSATRALLAGLWVVLAVTTVEARDRVYYFHNDHLGTPQALSNAAGKTVWEAEYEPFGKATVNEDPDGDGRSVINNLRFPGQYYDAETGLHYNYHRDYQPETGRYLQPDPLGVYGLTLLVLAAKDQIDFAGGDTNLYSYVMNAPVNFADPFGLYGYEVHFGLTYQLSIRAGYTAEQAGIIARADQGVDDSVFKSPFNPLGGTQLHFMTHDYALRGLDLARQKNDLELLGHFLHIMQDTYSHAGYKWYKGGHVADGTKPDVYNSSSCRDKAMRDETLNQLQQFRNRIY